MVPMKLKVIVFFAFVFAQAVAARSQQLPDPARDAGKKQALAFVKTAATVAGNVQHETVDRSTAVFIDEQNWAAGLKDGDIGPFLKVKEAKAGRSAACLFSEKKDSAVCVYFDGEKPFGVTAAKAGASGKIEAGDIAAASKSVTKEMLVPASEELNFTELNVATDDQVPLPGFVIEIVPKSK